MIDHLVLFTVKEEASPEDVDDMLQSLRALRSNVPSVIDFSVGENFSERGGPYTHGLFARFQTPDDLQAYLKHPDHRAAADKLNTLANSDRIVVDYDHGI